MLSRKSRSSNEKCLVCLSFFQSQRCKNPEYFSTLLGVLCRRLDIDLIEPIQCNFDEHGIPLCGICCSTLEKLKELTDQFEILQQQINHILNITKEKILKCGSVYNGSSSAKNVKLTLVNRVQLLRRQVSRGSSHLYNTSVQSEYVNPPNMEQFRNSDEVHSSHRYGIFDQSCIIKAEISENDALEEAENESNVGTDCVIESEYSATNSFKKDPDYSFFLNPSDCDSSVQLSSNTASNSLTGFKVAPIIPNDVGNNESAFDPETDNLVYRTEELALKCNFCNKSFRTLLARTEHLKLHTGEKTYPCNMCSRSFKTFLSLTSHQRIHTRGKKFVCDICKSSYEMKSTLTEHERIQTGERLFLCDICKKSFEAKSGLTKHRPINTLEKLSECNICKTSFRFSYDLTIHKRSHTEENTFKCDICTKAFARLSTLNEHRSVHTGEKPYNCDICGRSFRVKSSLFVHLRIHIGVKPYKCRTCGTTFRALSTLNKHERIHNWDRPFKCDLCKSSFANRGDLTKHERVHIGEKPNKVTEVLNAFEVDDKAKDSKNVEEGSEDKTNLKKVNRKKNVSDLRSISAISTPLKLRGDETSLKIPNPPSKSLASKEGVKIPSEHQIQDNPNTCRLCNRSFPNSSRLIVHRRFHWRKGF